MMLGIAQRLSTRIVSKRRLVARTALLALLAALLSSAPAWADETTVEPGPETVAGAPAEGSPQGSGEGGGGNEPPVAETAEPAPPPAPEAAPPPAPEAASETPPPAPIVEPVSEAPAPAPESPPESAQPVTPERPTSEGSGSEAPAHAKGDEKSAVLLPALPGPGSPSSTASAGGEAASTGTIAGTPTGSMVINLDEAKIAGETAAATHRTATPAGGAGAGGGPSCDLQGLGGPRAGGCAGGWLPVSGGLTPGGVALSPVGAAVLGAAVQGGGSISDDQGGTAGGGRPVPPSPGPAPGGASGGVAGGGGAGGIGLSGFLAFAGLLALTAPRALRRLRLACLPWRTAFFVLIPERPG